MTKIKNNFCLTDEEKETLATYDASAKNWSQGRSSAGFWTEEMNIFKKFLPQGKILEIGSGKGRDAKELVELGYDYVGTDVSVGLIEIAQKENPQIVFLNQSVYKLDFPQEKSFDGFWTAATLLHVPKGRVDEALGQIKKFIRPSGVGFISMKCGIGEKFELTPVGGVELKRFFAYYSEEEFKSVLLRNKFEILQTVLHPHPEVLWLCFFVKVL